MDAARFLIESAYDTTTDGKKDIFKFPIHFEDRNLVDDEEDERKPRPRPISISSVSTPAPDSEFQIALEVEDAPFSSETKPQVSDFTSQSSISDDDKDVISSFDSLSKNGRTQRKNKKGLALKKKKKTAAARTKTSAASQNEEEGIFSRLRKFVGTSTPQVDKKTGGEKRKRPGKRPSTTCQLCGAVLDYKGLQGHLMAVHRDSEMLISKFPHKCPTCPKLFAREMVMMIHAERSHGHTWPLPQHLEISCVDCSETFSSYAKLLNHGKSFHPGKGELKRLQPYKCKQCAVRFKYLSQAKEHTYRHHFEDEHPFKCDNCGQKFVTERNLLGHKQTVCCDRKCSQCEQRFSSNKDLKRHIRMVHKHREKSECPVCGSTVFTENLEAHMASNKVCKKASQRTKTKRKHNRTTTPFKCETCGKFFVCKDSLRMHLYVHGIGQVKQKAQEVTERKSKSFEKDCTICGAKLTSGRELRHHCLVVHNDTESWKLFRCEKCDKRFGQRSWLLQHYQRGAQRCMKNVMPK